MTMPGMGGDQLAQEIFEIRPNMSLIVCTGFHETMTPAKAEEMGIKKFLYKPVEKAVLGEAVRGALD
jgi:FixJ family two-component response regulator